MNLAVDQVFGAIRGIVKANLPVDRANEVFDEMRRVMDWIQEKANQVDAGNGPTPANADVANIVSSFGA